MALQAMEIIHLKPTPCNLDRQFDGRGLAVRDSNILGTMLTGQLAQGRLSLNPKHREALEACK